MREESLHAYLMKFVNYFYSGMCFSKTLYASKGSDKVCQWKDGLISLQTGLVSLTKRSVQEKSTPNKPTT